MKRQKTSLAVLFLLAFGFLAFRIGVVTVGSTPDVLTVDDDGPADFRKIQDAINVANDGDIISVAAGAYHESLYADNLTAAQFSIIGENEYTTIIDADASHGLSLNCWRGSRVNISQVTIRNADYGIWRSMGGNVFVKNCIIENCSVGVFFYVGNALIESLLRNNDAGIEVTGGGNIIFHNDFINNTEHVSAGYGSNTWDNGSESGGNYWDDYTGPDSNGDNIGDDPYYIPSDNNDNYPLMIPWRSPKVADILRTPIAPDYDDEATLTATITDRAGVDEAILSYNIASGWHNLSMTFDGDRFRAAIPKQAYDVVVEYRIYAKNNRGLWVASNLISYTVCDSTPPNVSVSRTPTNPNSVQSVKIHANVTEPNVASGVKIVHFSYRVNDGQWWNTTMTFNGTLRLYECTIPPQLSSDVVKYSVKAADYAGNESTAIEESYTVVTANELPGLWQYVAIALVALVGASCILLAYIYRKSRKPKS